MNTVKYEFFNSTKNYQINSNVRNLDVSWNDFYKHAIQLGYYDGRAPSSTSKEFYYSIIKFMIETSSNGEYIRRNEFEKAESSIKGAINFFMGMTAAKIIADKIYNVPRLYHLTDSTNQGWYTTYQINNQRGMHPDFIGRTQLDEILLIEAKGRSTHRLDKETLDKATAQLNAINKVYDIFDNGQLNKCYIEKDLKKNIVASTFSKDNNFLTFHDFDPTNGKDEGLYINFNWLTLNYYKNVMIELLNKEDKLIPSGENLKIQMNRWEIGLNKEIFNLLKQYKEYYLFEDKEKIELDNNLHKKIIAYSNDIVESEYNYSDGIYFKYEN